MLLIEVSPQYKMCKKLIKQLIGLHPFKKLMTIILIFVGLFSTACRDFTPTPKHFDFVPIKNIAISNGLPFNLKNLGNYLFHHSHKSFRKKQHPPLSTKTLKETPLLWERLASQFSLNYPVHHPRVQKYIQEFSNSSTYINQLAKNAKPYLYFITEEIEKRGLPAEFALLPMIESMFEPNANSKAGAVGLWQIMPETGKFYGLKADTWFDGRKDILASTTAAQNHLLSLHDRFSGNWLHVLAAYNSGAGKVLRAIEHNQKNNLPTDFWSLKLPQQTRDYVPKLLALAAIIKAPEKYQVTLPPIENKPFFETVTVVPQIHFDEAAKLAGISQGALKQLNPGYYRQTTSKFGPSSLLLPKAQVNTFQRKLKATAPNALATVRRHKIQQGETLSLIATRYKTTIPELKKINQLQTNTINTGKYLLIPS